MNNNTIYKYKNLTLHITRQYVKTRALDDILYRLMIQHENQIRSANCA